MIEGKKSNILRRGKYEEKKIEIEKERMLKKKGILEG